MNASVLALSLVDNQKSVEEILSSYDAELDDIKSNKLYADDVKQVMIAITKEERDEKLKKAGYDVFRVNPTSYKSVEEELKTDFSE